MQNGKAFPKMYDMLQHYSLKVLAIAYFLWSYFNNICVHYFIRWVAYLWMPWNHDSSNRLASKFFLVANTCKESVFMKFHPCYNDQKGLKLKLLLAPWRQCILVRFGLYVFYTLWKFKHKSNRKKFMLYLFFILVHIEDFWRQILFSTLFYKHILA